MIKTFCDFCDKQRPVMVVVLSILNKREEVEATIVRIDACETCRGKLVVRLSDEH